MVKTGLVEAIDSLVPLDEHLATFRGTDIQKESQKRPNQARDGKDKVNPKPKSKRLIRIGQNAYIEKDLKKIKMDNSKRVISPCKKDLTLKKSQRVECYCVAGFETDREMDNEVSDMIFFCLNGGAVDWKELQAKYHLPCLLSESEYISLQKLPWKLFGLGKFI
ncbi:hypothetical protein Tco_0269124 [Tanacetum coccineum]